MFNYGFDDTWDFMRHMQDDEEATKIDVTYKIKELLASVDLDDDQKEEIYRALYKN